MTKHERDCLKRQDFPNPLTPSLSWWGLFLLSQKEKAWEFFFKNTPQIQTQCFLRQVIHPLDCESAKDEWVLTKTSKMILVGQVIRTENDRESKKMHPKNFFSQQPLTFGPSASFGKPHTPNTKILPNLVEQVSTHQKWYWLVRF